MVYQDENNISYGLNTNLKVLSFNTNTNRRHKKKKKKHKNIFGFRQELNTISEVFSENRHFL